MKLRFKYLSDAAHAFERAPVEVALAVVSAAVMSWCIHTETDVDAGMRFLIGAFLTALFAWRSTLLYGMKLTTAKQRWIMTLIGAVFGALYLLLAKDLDLESEAWRAFLLVTAMLLWVFAMPGWVPIADDNANLRLRRINGRIVLRIIGGYLYGLALFAGVALAVVAVDKLFELGLKSKVYGHLWVWIMIALVPWVIAGGLDDYVRPIVEQSDVARVVHRMTSFLVPPLIVLYFAILYTYALRIAVTHELPQNLVSPMVIAAGLLVALGLLLFDPGPDAIGGQRLLRYAPIVFLPVAPLGLWALAARVDEYGWTEFRLLRVILLGLLLTLAVAASIQIMRRRTFSLRVLPMAAAFVLLLCAIGPWGVLPAARRDQKHRLAAALQKAGIDARKPPADTISRAIPAAQYGRIVGSAVYLRSHFGEGAVAEVVPGLPNGDGRVDVASFYHLRGQPSDRTGHMVMGQFPFGVGVPSGDGGTVYRIVIPAEGDSHGLPVPRVMRDTLRVVIGADTLRADLHALIQTNSMSDRGDGAIPPELASAPVTDAQGKRRGYFTVLNVMIENKSSRRNVQRLDGMLTLR